MEYGRGQFNELFESLAVVPEISLKGYLSPDANILHVNPDNALVIPDDNIAVAPKIRLKGFSDNMVIPEGSIEGITEPQLFDFYQNVYPNNENSEEQNELFQQYYDEYNERLKDGNLGDEKRKELLEKLQKGLKESGFPNSIFEYRWHQTDNPAIEHYEIIVPNGSEKKPKAMVLPSPAPDKTPKAIFLRGSSRKVE